jgi:hypothetical protein
MPPRILSEEHSGKPAAAPSDAVYASAEKVDL